MPEAITGRRFAFASAGPHFVSASVGENLVYGLKHRPLTDGEAADDHETSLRLWAAKESEISGNTTDSIDADWVDYAAAGVANRAELTAVEIRALGVAEMIGDVYEFGLRGTIDPRRARRRCRAYPHRPRQAARTPGRARLRRARRIVRCGDLQHQRVAGREPAVRHAGRRYLRSRASRRQQARAGGARRLRPDRRAAAGGLPGGAHHARAVLGHRARSRVLRAVQLHQGGRLSRLQGPDRPRRLGQPRRARGSRPHDVNVAAVQADPGASPTRHRRRRHAGARPRGARRLRPRFARRTSPAPSSSSTRGATTPPAHCRTTFCSASWSMVRRRRNRKSAG